MPRQDNSLNGRIVKAKVEVSLDGENWDTVVDEVSFVNDMTTKTIFLETPTFANYVKITGLETKGPGSYASAAMINLYENTLNKTKDVKDLDISYISNGYIYNGNPQEPTLKIMDKDKELILNEHYKLEFGNNINAGEATITITGLGIYTGTVTKTFTISKANKPAILPELKMEASANEDYLRDLTLIAGWHWENPDTLLKAGKTIDAIAVFEDTANYENPKVTISVTKDVGNKPEITTSKDKFVFKIGVDEEKPLEYFLSFVKITDVEDGEIAIDSGKVEITSDLKDYQTAGTYHINIKVTDSDDNTQELALEISLIDPNSEFIDISKFKVELKDESYVYSGEEIKPTVLVKDKDHTLTPDVDYDVKYINNINAGDGAVIITGKGMYKGSLSKTFIIKKRPVPTKSIFPSITVSKDTINLGSIDLPEGWAWQDEDQKLVVGENKVKVIYLGDMNHERYETEVIVIKEDKEDNNQESKPSETPSTPEVKPEDNTNNNSTNKPNNTPNNSNSNTNSNTNTNTNTNSNVTSPSTQDDTKKDSEAVSKDEAKEEDKKDSTLKEESNMPLGSLERQGESEYERVRAIEDNIAIIGMVVTALLIGGILIFTKRR